MYLQLKTDRQASCQFNLAHKLERTEVFKEEIG